MQLLGRRLSACKRELKQLRPAATLSAQLRALERPLRSGMKDAVFYAVRPWSAARVRIEERRLAKIEKIIKRLKELHAPNK